MSATKKPSIRTQVVQILSAHGPMDCAGMMNYITGVEKKSVHNECLELEKLNLVSRDANDVWSVREGVTPETLKTGELKTAAPIPGSVPPPPATPPAPPIPPPPELPKSAGMTLDQRVMFMSHLVGIGVQPKEAIPSITDIFFTGDINNLQWLKQVLEKEAPGFVRPDQRKTIISWWAHTRGLPFKEEDFPFLEEEPTKGKKVTEKEPPKSTVAKVMEKAGVGYQVVRDKDGVWIARLGGELTYEAALDRCETQNTIMAMGRGQVVEPEEAAEEGTEGKPAVKGAKKAESLQDYFMKKVIDEFIEGRHGRGDEDNPQIKEMSKQLEKATSTIEQMREEREQERFDRIEANIAALAAQNPWEDTASIERMRQRLGIQPSGITDSSPAVQIIKDTTQKMDKQADRLAGLVERFIIKTDEFRPEEKRSPEEKEAKAAVLLDEATKRKQSSDIRKRAFNQFPPGG